MPTTEAVITQLKTLGRGQIDNFNMLDADRRAAAATLPVKGYVAQTGYCHGVCLDWIRRVLQGGRPHFGPSRSPRAGYDYNARRQEQAKRQGYAWAGFDALKVRAIGNASAATELSNASYERNYANYLAADKLLADVLHLLMADYEANASLGEARIVRITYGARLQRVYPVLQAAPASLSVAQIGGLFEKIQQKRLALKKPVRTTADRSTAIQATYGQFATHMDSKFAGKKRSFSGISLIQALPDKQYPSLQAAVASVTSAAPAEFHSGRAMILSFGMEQGGQDVGHALALHWDAHGSFVLLDPNYGMYNYAQLHGPNSVSSALTYLLSTAYPEPGLRVTNKICSEVYGLRTH